MKTLTPLLLSALLAAPTLAAAQERTANGSLENQMNWTALKSLIEVADLKAQSAIILAQAIATCNKKSMLYNPEGSGKDENGCTSVGGNRAKKASDSAITFSSRTSSNSVVKKTYEIPNTATALSLNIQCTAKTINGIIKVDLAFNGENASIDTLCQISGVSGETMTFGYTKLITVPDGATSFTITRTSAGADIKSISAKGFFLRW